MTTPTFLEEMIDLTATNLHQISRPNTNKKLIEAHIRALSNTLIGEIKDSLPLACKDACITAIDDAMNKIEENEE